MLIATEIANLSRPSTEEVQVRFSRKHLKMISDVDLYD